jgi:hypothetical protein
MQFLSSKMNDNEKEDDDIMEVYALPRKPLPPLLKPVPVLDISLSVGHSDGHSVGDSISFSVEASVEESVPISGGDSMEVSVEESPGLSVGDSVEESVPISGGDSMGVSAEESPGLSVGDSVEESVRILDGDSVGLSAEESAGLSVGKSPELSVQVELTPPTSTTTNSESLSDEIRATARRNLRQQLEARIARERDLQATMADVTFITSMSGPEIDIVFVDDWREDESSFTTPTKTTASASNRPMSPVANRVLHFPPVANSTLRPPPVPNRVLRPPPVAEMVLAFPILNENHLQLHLKADRKRRQREQKERWLATNEAKKVLSYLIWYCFSVSD